MTPFDRVDQQRLRAGSGVKWTAVPDDVLPMWVADMDFGIPPVVRERLRAVLEREDLGYPFWPDTDPVLDAFEDRMRERHGWSPAPGRALLFSDLIQILQVVIEQATAPGDGIAVHVPCYPPFLDSIARAGRRIVPIPMICGSGRWEFSTVGLSERLRAAGVRLLVLVNPQNPTGRCFDRDELAGLAAVAAELDLVVLADEIHADLTQPPHRHLPFAAVGADPAARTVTATSATKAFNIAGLRCAVAHIGSDALHRRLTQDLPHRFGSSDIFSRVATVAAWREGADWLAELLPCLRANRDRLAEWAGRFGIGHHPPEAGYLGWLDFAGTPIAADPAGALLDRGRLRLVPGPYFSAHTDVPTGTFARINLATSPDLVTDALGRIERTLAAGGV